MDRDDTSHDYAVRPVRPGDLAALLELEGRVFAGESWSEAALRSFLLAGRDVVLVAERAGGGLLGYVCFLRLVDDVELLRLAVEEEARRQGVGRALFERGLELHRGEGLVSCHLEVRSDNEGAVGFYQRLGFEEVGSRRSYYRDGCDALLMTRAL